MSVNLFTISVARRVQSVHVVSSGGDAIGVDAWAHQAGVLSVHDFVFSELDNVCEGLPAHGDECLSSAQSDHSEEKRARE